MKFQDPRTKFQVRIQRPNSNNPIFIWYLVFGIWIIVWFLAFISWNFPAQAQENVQFFGSEPLAQEQSRGRNIASCLSGWRQFIAAGIGFEDFSDYWRDFLLWPSHYADVASVQDQLNKSRYAVMAAFLRCDLNRLKSVTDAYYRLEAELYFVRHYVDTNGGFTRLLTETPGSRQKFVNEMLKYMILLKPAPDENSERALYSGYFDLFEAQYTERGKTYASFGEDPVFQELGAKWDELVETFKSFSSLGHELKELGNEAIVEPVVAIKKAVPTTFREAKKNLVAGIKGITDRLDACITTPDNRYCRVQENRSGSDYGPGVKNIDILDIFGSEDNSQKRTFQEVMVAIERQEVQRSEDIDKVEMLARYEILYGQVSGDGVYGLMANMDKLLAILGQGNREVQGSLVPLQKIEQCATQVKGSVCSNLR